MTLVSPRSNSQTPWSPDVMPITGAFRPRLDLFNTGPDLSSPGGARLLLNMYETPTHVVVDLALPGVRADDLDVQVEGLTVTIRGRYTASPEDSTRYWYKALPEGEFLYRLTLPVKVSEGDVDATLDSGLLHLYLPKAPEARTRKIDVKRAGDPASRH